VRRCSCALSCVVIIASFVFAGCSGLVAGNSGNPPPTTLAITNVSIGAATTSSCQVDWTTNVLADSAVDYGTSTSYGSTTPVDPAMVTSHQVALSGLAPNTVYYYQVRSTDSKSSKANSGGHSFKTLGAAPSITAQPTSQTVTAGQTASFSVAATGTAPFTYQWQKNSVAITGATSSSYTTPVTTSSDNGAQFTAVVSNTAGSATSSAAILTVNAAPVAPSITTQPASQTVTAGQTASFSVVATGTAPLNYQWQKNSVAITGATSSSYTTPVTTSSDNGAQFTVVVSNTVGSATSSAAILTVNAAPVAPSITTQPASQSVTTGQTASFNVAATGTSPLAYQWQKNSVAISGATSSSYTTPVTTSSDNGAQFTVVISNTVGNVTSSAATLTVTVAPVAPSIATQPASQTVTAGQTASFSVAATGTAPLNYQWQKNSVAIGGATSSSYTTPVTTSSDNGAQFSVVVSNTAGSITSSTAILTVNAAPVAPSITTQPASQTVTAGQPASFSVVATGTAPLTYQWQKNSVAIGGATSSSYTTPVTTSSDNGAQFTVVVSNTAGSVTSSAALLTVNAAQISVVPTSVSFGNVVTGTANTQTITLTNSGTASLAISQAPVSGNGFSITGLTLPLTLSPGQSTNFNVAFAPAGVGSVSGTVSLVSNAPNSPLAISLSGTGVAANFLLGANPTTLGFGTVNVGSSSPLGVTLTNNGNSNVTISSVTVSGAGFSASGVSAGATLTTNQSVTLNVTFAPLAAGSLTGTVTVASNATNTPAIIALSGIGAATTIINVKNYGATGNGSTDDTVAIDNAIAALQPGDELYFPCGTYLVSSQLAAITKNNVTIDGQLACSTGPVTIKNTGSTDNLLLGDTSLPHTGYINLNAPITELSNTFTGNFSSIGLATGDYISISQGGVGGNTSGGLQNSAATQCDVAGCQGEMLKIASVNGNTATVTTAFHDSYNPANIVPGGASASNIGLGITKFTNIVTGINIHDLAFDGSGTSHTSILAFGVADLTVSNISAKNFTGHGIFPQFNFNTSWTNINLSVDGCDDFGIDFFGGGHNTVNGLTSSGGNGAWCNPSVGGSNGLGVKQTADSTFSNVTVDKAGTPAGRPMKLDGARYNTFNNLTVKNGPSGFNGVSVEYYSSHNTFNSPVIQGNQSCNGCGGAGVNMFGNYNQYNTFNNPTITGNGNLQFYQYGVAQLADSHTTISGGTIGGGVNTGGSPVIGLSSDSPYVHNVMISGPGGPGIGMSSPTANSCINNNTFTTGTGLGSAISSNGSTNTGLGNILNGLSSNLTAGTCGPFSARLARLEHQRSMGTGN
jgi:Pectate lyase superfamily protein/Abnormal spindle-like microcephaly-assoc'd, ASPM-SPD-2-Hydin/Purple acid Phosphatase, N-terminal domain/Immunoglobulin domain